MTDISALLSNKTKGKWAKLASCAILFYLYLTIPMQGNFLFRNRYLKPVIFFLSWIFFLFTVKIMGSMPYLLVIPVVISVFDEILKKRRGRGLNFLVYESWGILMSCCWIVNLMLLMMDILLFLSNIFGVSILLFTCIFIAIGNNTAGIKFFIFFPKFRRIKKIFE